MKSPTLSQIYRSKFKPGSLSEQTGYEFLMKRSPSTRKFALVQLEEAFIKGKADLGGGFVINLVGRASDFSKRVERSIFSVEDDLPNSGRALLRGDESGEMLYALEKALLLGSSWTQRGESVEFLGESAARDSDMMVKSARLAHRYLRRLK